MAVTKPPGQAGYEGRNDVILPKIRGDRGLFALGKHGELTFHKGDSLNQKAVNLHMLEDVLGWVVVLIGAIVMRFTDLSLPDPLMSIGVSVFIFVNAAKNLGEIGDVFLEKAPVDTALLHDRIMGIEGVCDVHHIHIRTIDGYNHCATMHIVTDRPEVKAEVRRILHDNGICHATLELEAPGETCPEPHCHIHHHEHHHHHHHHH